MTNTTPNSGTRAPAMQLLGDRRLRCSLDEGHQQALRAHAPRKAPRVRQHPFVDRIIETPYQKGRGMHLDKYDDTINPNKNLANYITQYTQLLANSIDSFETLKKRFDTQYLTSRPHHLTSMVLVNLRQGESKSLCSFMAHFSNVSMKIRNHNLEVVLHSIIMALKLGPFPDNLYKLSPKDMDNLKTRASGYI
ncbi:hypothetical protein CR513_25614, partial [Mucuna pruriens]